MSVAVPIRETNLPLLPESEAAERNGIHIYHGDVSRHYAKWPSPTVIISDGPYGLASFPGDPPTVDSLVDFYEPHVKAWSDCALPSATLWFWNSELAGV